MQRIFVRIKRATFILAVWFMAIVALCYCVGIWQERRVLAQEVDQLAQQYDSQIDEYTTVLAGKQELIDNPEAQKKFLKHEMGYAEPDEIPIVILTEE